MSAWTCRSTDGKTANYIVPPRPRIPCWKGLGADSEEKHEPASDINTAVVDSLKTLDLKRPIREADILRVIRHVSKGRVEDGRGSLGHLATLRFPSPLIEPDVPD